MPKYLYVTILIFAAGFVAAQTPPAEYHALVKAGDSLYWAKEYKQAAITYSAAFKAFGWKGFSNDRYSAAQAWALAGNADSAFFNLYRIAEKGNFSDYKRITVDDDFFTLYKDKRWLPLIEIIKVNRDKYEAGFNRPLLYLLDSMATEDQKWRKYLTKFDNGELVGDTITIKTLNHNCVVIDSLNYPRLKTIFSNYGFPNYDIVGIEGARNFWLLVQHQDRHPDFQDSVLSKMKVQVDSGKASSSDYAYLVDRVKINTGKPQVYGTQITVSQDGAFFEPKDVIDKENLNERRKSMGLSSIEEYIAFVSKIHGGSLKKK